MPCRLPLHHEQQALPLNAASTERADRNNYAQFHKKCCESWIRLTRSDVRRPLFHRYAERTISSVVFLLARICCGYRMQQPERALLVASEGQCRGRCCELSHDVRWSADGRNRCDEPTELAARDDEQADGEQR